MVEWLVKLVVVIRQQNSIINTQTMKMMMKSNIYYCIQNFVKTYKMNKNSELLKYVYSSNNKKIKTNYICVIRNFNSIVMSLPFLILHTERNLAVLFFFFSWVNIKCLRYRKNKWKSSYNYLIRKKFLKTLKKRLRELIKKSVAQKLRMLFDIYSIFLSFANEYALRIYKFLNHNNEDNFNNIRCDNSDG